MHQQLLPFLHQKTMITSNTTSTTTEAAQFHFVPEMDEQFLRLFPHRWDYLWAEHTQPGKRVDWHSETRFPLGDRLIQEGKNLYGVRFGSTTSYFMLDIDKDSPYHPTRGDRFATGRMLEALEVLGITDHIAVSSSYSQGIHLYFPLLEPASTWELAAAVSQCLRNKGFWIQDGILEIFPNERNWNADESKYSLFKGHRLPLQAGSYLMNDFWEIEWGTSVDFCSRWQFCQRRNQINEVAYNRLLNETTRHSKMGFKAQKFLSDLNTEIEPGWTGKGQTNYLLGRIALRSYVFGHKLNGGEPLTGDRLVCDIVNTATRLPGYKEWCRHQDEIWKRAEEWARCAESCPRYYPYGHRPGRLEKRVEQPPVVNRTNKIREREAEERIAFAIARLWDEGRFPATITGRFNALTKEFGFSGQTLYRPQNLGLWHPNFIGAEPVDNPPDPPNVLLTNLAACSSGAQPNSVKSLLTRNACNPSNGADQEWFKEWNFEITGCNPATGKGFDEFGRRLVPDGTG